MTAVHLYSGETSLKDPIPHFLSRFTGKPAEDFKIERTSKGKPYLPNHDLCFSLSHSGEKLLFACCFDREIGVDIEFNKARSQWRQLANRFFAEDEKKEATSIEKFLEIWTLKESYLKMLGGGIDRELKSFSIFNLPCQSHSLSHWPSYFAAIAVEGTEPIQLEIH